MIRTFLGSVFSGTQMENDVMDTACQNNNPHLNLHVRDILHLKCQTCKMDCLQKLIRGTSIVLNFKVLTWKKKKPNFKLYQKSLQNLTLCSCYFFTFICTSRPHPLCHLDHNSWADIFWWELDMTAYTVPHWLEGQFLLLPSKALSRITSLLVSKKVEDQASKRKLLRKEVSTSVV